MPDAAELERLAAAVGSEAVIGTVHTDCRAEISDRPETIVPALQRLRAEGYEDLRSVRDLFCRAAMQGNYEVEEIDPKLLGFSIVKDIADLHGGRIGVQSIEGEGSTFTLHLPGRRRRIA